MNAVSLLEEAGFGVLEASSADDAIALLGSRKNIRIVFTDINMPGSMDGLTCTRHPQPLAANRARSYVWADGSSP
jgi:CheY-like chemotaxis protein